MLSSHLWMRNPLSPNKTGVSSPTQARAAPRIAELTAISNKTLATCSSNTAIPGLGGWGRRVLGLRPVWYTKRTLPQKSQGWGYNAEASTCLVLICKVLGWPATSPEWHEVFTATVSKACAFLIYFHWIPTKVTISFIAQRRTLYSTIIWLPTCLLILLKSFVQFWTLHLHYFSCIHFLDIAIMAPSKNHTSDSL